MAEVGTKLDAALPKLEAGVEGQEGALAGREERRVGVRVHFGSGGRENGDSGLLAGQGVQGMGEGEIDLTGTLGAAAQETDWADNGVVLDRETPPSLITHTCI